MEHRVWSMALAGLLHDLGKFAQRAGVRGSRIWDEQAKRDYGYYHALLSEDCVQQFVPPPWLGEIKDLVGSHHRSDDRAQRILALADHLSAGERADLTDDTSAAQPRQLLSIFCSLKGSVAEIFWPLAPLALNEQVLFPARAWDERQVERRYSEMWTEFTGEMRRLRQAHEPGGDLAVYLESLLWLLQRYTWCIPSAYYKARPDISLYDHGRMTAALAAVLADAPLSDEGLRELLQRPQESAQPLALLVGGDLSGVQDFIYTITAKGATSALRGRSFYLQLLTDALARYILRRLELPITNLIYAGGGHFYLLARADDEKRLASIQQDISRILLRYHHGELYTALASYTLQGKDFFEGRVSGAWAEMGARLQLAKQRRFSELGAELQTLFTPQGHGGNEEAECQVCGREDRRTKVEEEVRKCPACSSYESLGDSLRQARYLIFEEAPLDAPPAASMTEGTEAWGTVLRAFGLAVKVAADQVPEPEKAAQVAFALSDEAWGGLRPGPRTAVGRRFLVNVTPIITDQEIRELRRRKVPALPAAGSIKPFHVMEAQSEGIARLGVLRMDVDNLGKLFSEGLKEKATLSRVAALSFAISLYFEGWVEELAARRNRQDAAQPHRGERLYSIYSGGDDLFFVGSWDAVVELAREIRADLSRYAAGHPDVHASAGIALVGGKYPLYQAAQEALEAEDMAKSLQWLDNDGQAHRKDAIAFLGQALPWARFGLQGCPNTNLNTAHSLMHRLVEIATGERKGDKAAPRALLRHLIDLYMQYRREADKRRREGAEQNRLGQRQILWGRWMWLAFYILSRMAERTRQEGISRLRDWLQAEGFRHMEQVGLAARWAELYLRQATQNENR